MGCRRSPDPKKAHPLTAELQEAGHLICGSSQRVLRSVCRGPTFCSSKNRTNKWREAAIVKQGRFTVKLMKLKFWGPSLGPGKGLSNSKLCIHFL